VPLTSREAAARTRIAPTNGTIIGSRQCSDFCSDPTIRRTYPDTAAHILVWQLNALLSEQTLSRKILRRLVRLPSKQRVGGSNPSGRASSHFVEFRDRRGHVCTNGHIRNCDTVSAAPANALPAFVSLTPSIGPSASGSMLVAVVNTPKAIPGGNLTFLDGGVILGTAQTSESGIASLRVPALASGGHSLSASFGGRASFAPSVSPTILDEWPETGPGFNVTLGASTMNVGPSRSDSLNVTVVALPGFARPVQMSCSTGVPAGYSCNFSPNDLNAGRTSTHTIRSSTNNAEKSPKPIPLFAIAAGLFAFVLLGRSSRRSHVVVVLLLCCFAGALGGCGISSLAENSAKTIVLTIRANSGSGVDAIVHSAQIAATFQTPN
jgi:hypothetical protein